MTPDDVDVLTSATGQDVLRLAQELAESGATTLAAGTALRREFDAGLVALAMTQVELRRKAAAKFSRAADMLFTREGLEQASSERTSGYRARRLAGADGSFADLCCGIGGDLIALGEGHRVVGVDRDPVHVAMAAHNADVHDVAENASAVVGDVQAVCLLGVEVAYVDPARRRGGRRTTQHTDPSMDWCYSLADGTRDAVIKAAPGIDVASVPDGWEVSFLAEGRDLKEAVLWSPALAGARTRAVLLPSGEELVPQAGEDVEVREPGRWLLDPNPAVTRAGAVADLARILNAWQIDPRIAFLSADAPMRTPWGRLLRIEDSLPWDERRLRALLRERGVGSVDIRRRGLAGDVDTIRSRLRLRGSEHRVLVMTRAQDRPWALVCTATGDRPGHTSL